METFILFFEKAKDHKARHPGRLKRLVTKRFGKGKITCSKARAMKSSKNTLTKKQAQRYINYHC